MVFSLTRSFEAKVFTGHRPAKSTDGTQDKWENFSKFEHGPLTSCNGRSCDFITDEEQKALNEGVSSVDDISISMFVLDILDDQDLGHLSSLIFPRKF